MPTSMSTDAKAPCSYGAHVQANGIRQHYLRFGGRGRPLIVIPGIASPAATWAFVGERLGPFCDTYVLDVRGRGLSEGGPHLRYDLETYSADIAAFAAAIGLDDYDILGHSMGARIAARTAIRPEAPIRRVVLADPPVSGPGRRPYGRSTSFYLQSIRAAVQGRLDAEAVRQTYPTWSDSQLRLRAEWLHTCDESAIEGSVRGFQEEEIQSVVARMTVPTQLIVAGRGGVISEEDVAELRSLLPSIEVRRMENAGHMLPFDDLEGFLKIVLAFLERP